MSLAREPVAEYEAVVRDWNAVRGYEAVGPAIAARCDPPFRPWFMRRNEVLVPVSPHDS